MTLTARQIREARTLLGMERGALARRAGGLTGLDILEAEQAEDGSTLSIGQAAIRDVLERAGAVFEHEVASNSLVRIQDVRGQIAHPVRPSSLTSGSKQP